MKTEKPENEVEASDQITCREAGRRGGTATRDRFAGTDFYQRIGAKGGKRQKELYSDLLAEYGRLGGRPRRPSLNEHVGEGDHHKKEEIYGRPGDSLSPPEL